MHQLESSANPSNEQKHAPSSFGVVLFAFGKPQYFWAAYNLAYSIKRHNKSIQIALISEPLEKGARYYCPELSDVIDLFVDLPHENLYVDKKIDPARCKLLMYDLLPFDENLYLDVDAVCLKDLQPVIDNLRNSERDYQTYILGTHTIDKGRDIATMQWAWGDDIWQHFELSEKTVMPAINSSVQFVRKSIESEKIFSIAKDQYLNNPLPVHKLRSKWGGGQPDELYTNIALAKLGYDASMELEPLYIVYKRELSISEVQEKYYLQGYFGGTGFTPRYYTEWIDRLLKSWMRQDGRQHIYFIERIIQNKYVTGKR
jgi:hypothetical protein